MDTLQNLKTLLLVARRGGLAKAASELGVSASVVTKRINQLEARAGVRLLQRSTRHVALTDIGRAYIARIRSVVDDADDLLAAMARAPRALEGHIRVKGPTAMTTLHLGGAISAFQTAHPGVSLEIVLVDRPVNPVDEGYDVALGALPQSFGGVVAQELCGLSRFVCAAPSYLARRGAPRHPSDLAAHDLLIYAPLGPIWSFRGPSGEISIEAAPKLTANNPQLLLEAARAGNGIAVLSTYVAAPALRSGELVALLTSWRAPDYAFRAFIPESRANVPRVQAFVACLKAALNPVPPWERPHGALSAAGRPE